MLLYENAYNEPSMVRTNNTPFAWMVVHRIPILYSITHSALNFVFPRKLFVYPGALHPHWQLPQVIVPATAPPEAPWCPFSVTMPTADDAARRLTALNTAAETAAQ